MVHRTRRVQLLTLFAFALSLAPHGARMALADDARCFPEIGQCISGRFRSFWEENGGLAVFGYPIAAPSIEINRDDAQPYQTQWFERNRFELHPENAAPYDVLLGRLGDDLLRRRGIDWQTQPPEAGPQPGCLWFAQTGHNVCNQVGGLGFKSYWQSHGLQDAHLDAYGRSLALLGLPLSEAHSEVSATDGHPYLTQWFERARLEWHPENQDAYKVLLGLLGNDLRSSSAQQIAEHVTSGKPVGDAEALYWFEQHNQVSELFSFNLVTGTKRTLSGSADVTIRPVVRNDWSTAWVERSPDGKRQYVILEERFPRIGPMKRVLLETSGDAVSTIDGIALEGDMLYYVDTAPGHTGLYAHDTISGTETLIDAQGSQPVVKDGILLWSTHINNGQSGANFRQNWSLHLRKLASGEDRIVTTIPETMSGSSVEYAVSGDYVIWVCAATNVDNRLFLYQISSGVTRPISPDPASSPSISGSTIVWAAKPNATVSPLSTQGWSIQSYDLSTGAVQTVAEEPAPQQLYEVALAAGRVAYVVKPDSQTDWSLYLSAPR